MHILLPWVSRENRSIQRLLGNSGLTRVFRAAPANLTMGPIDQSDDTGNVDTVSWSPASDTSTKQTFPSVVDTGAASLLGDYELLSEIGRGGMGVVFKARQLSANRIVALKLVRSDLLKGLPPADRQEWLDRFRIEAQAAAHIDHAHVVTVFEVGEIDGQHFYAMHYVDGESLEQTLRRGPIANVHAGTLMRDVASAIDSAHARGILHRDLKPGNILIDGTDRPYVADFGLAKWFDTSVGMTQTGHWLGSPSYMSPEQVTDSSRVSFASDIYSLGATLYALLTGRPPFRGLTTAETLNQVLHQQPVPPKQINPGVDLDLQTICLKCLEKEPPHRYLSAAALVEDLQRYLNQEPISARHTGPAERVWRWCRRPDRIRDVGVFTLVISAVFAIWNLFGLAALMFNLMPTEQPAQAFIIIVLDFLGFVACLWIGLGTLARKKRMLWAGLGVAAIILSFVLACMLGLEFDAGGWLKDPAVRLPVLSFFGVLAAVMLAAYVIAIFAHYSHSAFQTLK